MELVTEVQVHSEQSVEEEVQKTLRMIHRVMASNSNKCSTNTTTGATSNKTITTNNKTMTTNPTTEANNKTMNNNTTTNTSSSTNKTTTTTANITPTGESKSKTRARKTEAETTTREESEVNDKVKDTKNSDGNGNSPKGQKVSVGNSIEQLLNDPLPEKSEKKSKTQGKDSNDAMSNDKIKSDLNGLDNSEVKTEGDAGEDVKPDVTSGTGNTGSGSSVSNPSGGKSIGGKSASCVITTSTAQTGMMNNSNTTTVTIGEVQIKQEPLDHHDGVLGEDVMTGIPANAILTEAGPSEVQDIRSMLPVMGPPGGPPPPTAGPVVPPPPGGSSPGIPTIPSRGPGIRHRYTMVKTPHHPAPPVDTHVCEVCQCELPSQKHLANHKLCHFNTSHVCYACDTYFVHSDTLVMHMATLHRDLNPGGQAAIDDGLVCSVCLQRFSSQNNLAKHHNIHMLKDGKSCACRVCGLDLPGARALMTHLSSSGHLAMKVRITKH